MQAAAAAGAGPGAWRLAEGTAPGLLWGLASGGDVNLGSNKNKLSVTSCVQPERPVEGWGCYDASRSAQLHLPRCSRKEKYFAQRLFLQPRDLSSCAGEGKKREALLSTAQHGPLPDASVPIHQNQTRPRSAHPLQETVFVGKIENMPIQQLSFLLFFSDLQAAGTEEPA